MLSVVGVFVVKGLLGSLGGGGSVVWCAEGRGERGEVGVVGMSVRGARGMRGVLGGVWVGSARGWRVGVGSLPPPASQKPDFEGNGNERENRRPQGRLRG